MEQVKYYRFSPMLNEDVLKKAAEHVHFACYELCKKSFGHYFPNAGNMGIFCHYEHEFDALVELRKKLTEPSENADQKYFKLHQPIVIPSRDDVPEANYTHLYIRKPDPYRHHVGDVDFYLEPTEYEALKQSLIDGTKIAGARIFPRQDMVELYNPDIDALAYISKQTMTEKVRIKINPALS